MCEPPIGAAAKPLRLCDACPLAALPARRARLRRRIPRVQQACVDAAELEAPPASLRAPIGKSRKKLFPSSPLFVARAPDRGPWRPASHERRSTAAGLPARRPAGARRLRRGTGRRDGGGGRRRPRRRCPRRRRPAGRSGRRARRRDGRERLRPAGGAHRGRRPGGVGQGYARAAAGCALLAGPPGHRPALPRRGVARAARRCARTRGWPPLAAAAAAAAAAAGRGRPAERGVPGRAPAGCHARC